MKVGLAVSLTVLFLLVQAYPAMAAWGSFVSLGTNTVNSDPSCAPLTSGDAVCAARSFTNTMLVNQFNGTTWAGWKNLAGAITSPPSCAPDGNGQAICAARATNGGMVYTVFNGTIWSTEVKVKASLATGLSCATLGAVACCVRRAAQAADSLPVCSMELRGALLTTRPQARPQRRAAGATMLGGLCA